MCVYVCVWFSCLVCCWPLWFGVVGLLVGRFASTTCDGRGRCLRHVCASVGLLLRVSYSMRNVSLRKEESGGPFEFGVFDFWGIGETHFGD